MERLEQLEYWAFREIPAWLDKVGTAEVFNKVFPGAGASLEWKVVALAMAKERWGSAVTVKKTS